MRQWLENYANTISINWWVFAAAGISTIFIALLTISFQAIKKESIKNWNVFE
jgi:putative ABC transport system permease protein